MHKVIRNEAPLKLIKKDKEWKEKLSLDKNIKIDWDVFSKTVAKKDTLNKLEEMYSSSCCYCESKIKSTSYPEIEHFKSKSKYPELCYEYKNLHYCCRRCNLAKSNKYDDNFIDPSFDDPEEFIKYVGEYANSIDNNLRGTTMIGVIKLNDREELIEERRKYISEFSKNYNLLIQSIEIGLKSDNEESLNIIRPFIKSFIDNVESKSKHGQSYCSMIKNNFQDEIALLKVFL